MNRHCIYIAAILQAGLMANALSAQTTSPSTRASISVGRLPEFINTKRIEDSLLNMSRQVVVFPSQPREAGAAQEAATQEGAIQAIANIPRLPDGYFIPPLQGQARKQGDWYEIYLQKTEKLGELPPLRVLPNSRLEMLENLLSRSDQPSSYVVEGRITEFQNVNYILIENLMQGVLPPPEKEEGKPREQVESAPSNGGTAGTRPSTGREPTAEEVAAKLMEFKPLRAIEFPRSAEASDRIPATEPGKEGDHALKEDTILIDRLGRLVQGENWWLFVFEDRGDLPKDKPIHILPNRILENALEMSKGGTVSGVFIVTGEVTVYKTERYLLLRKAIVRKDMGNLR